MVLAGVLILGKSNLIALPQGMLAIVYLGHTIVSGVSSWETLGLVSLGILLVGELSQWSFDRRVAGQYAVGLHVTRAIGVGLQLALGLGVISLAAATAAIASPADPWAIAAATAASLALLALISIVAGRALDGTRLAGGVPSEGSSLEG